MSSNRSSALKRWKKAQSPDPNQTSLVESERLYLSQPNSNCNMRTIASLTAGDKRVDVEGTIVWKGETKSFDKNGNTGTVASALIRDASGSIQVSLFNELIDQVSKDSKLSISNAYVTEFGGKPQLNIGRYGKVTVE